MYSIILLKLQLRVIWTYIYVLSGWRKKELLQKEMKKELFEMTAEAGAISNERYFKNKRI